MSLIEILARVHAKDGRGGGGGGRTYNEFEFGTFIGRLQGDDACSMGVKGLMSQYRSLQS